MARRKMRAKVAEEAIEPVAGTSETESAVRGVGAMLREARERRGWNIPDIAQQLRIRAAVLEAMEAGRFETLPNGAYALGFVRSYADFLGLDRDEIARRVKAEAAALNARTELVFPKPISEGRMPSGVVLLVSVALAIAGYGLWYYHSSNVRVAAPRVEAVPERLAAKVDRPAKSPSDAEAATVATASAPATSDTATTAAKPAGETPAASVPAVVPSPDAPPAPASTDSSAGSSASTTSEPQVASLPAPAAPATSSTTSATTSPASEVKPPPAPKQYGESDGTSRIVIKATADSWVQVRDPGGAVVFSRILRDGDSYSVTNRTGQVLATGNAGVLEIMVDGKKAPAIGRPGFTQKDVPLDPTRLLAGTAATEPRAARPKPAAPAATAPAPSPPAATPPASTPPETPATNG